MVYFVGAGTGAVDLITVRGMRLLEKADVIIYAGSLVNPELLQYANKDCEIHDSAKLTLEEVLTIIQKAETDGKITVRLHTGEPSIYGAVREQMDELDRLGKLSGSQCLFWSRCILKFGIYSAGDFPVVDHYENGGKNAGTGKRKYRKLCCTSGIYGNILKYRNAERVK